MQERADGIRIRLQLLCCAFLRFQAKMPRSSAAGFPLPAETPLEDNYVRLGYGHYENWKAKMFLFLDETTGLME